MNEILNNLEKISNLLAENENFSIEDFTPISKLIAETEMKVIRLCEVSGSLPSDIKITSEIEKLGMQKLLYCKGIYTSEKLHLDIYKYAFKKAQEPSENG